MNLKKSRKCRARINGVRPLARVPRNSTLVVAEARAFSAG